MERRKKIAVELSELVVYCRPVPFNEDSKDQTSNSRLLFLTLLICFCARLHFISNLLPFPRNWHGESVLPGHVVLPRDKSGEVCDTRPRETLPAVQPPAAFQSLSTRTEAGLVQLRPAAHVALWLPAGRTQFPDARSVRECVAFTSV